MKNIAIVGAGAAGLFSATLLSQREDFSVTIFEKAQKIGTKLRASGGGRANILNTNIKPAYYNHPEFIESLLKKVDYHIIRDEFTRMGLRMAEDEEGRVYPATFFSQTVIDVLLNRLSSVNFVTDYEVKVLRKKNEKWQVNESGRLYDVVLLASGSPAGMIAKNRQSYNGYLSDLKVKQENLEASLVGFVLEKYPKELSGCRAKAAVSLLQNGEKVYSEIGEVIFKDDGVSGIVVMNVSAHYNRLKNKANCSLSFNFLFDEDTLDVAAYERRFGNLAGLLHPKLNKIHQKNGFDLRNFQMKIVGVYDLEFAQVCHGGIALEEVGRDFELHRFPGLFAVGELLDIDGVCGGYNLFFAFASAYCAAHKILKIK